MPTRTRRRVFSESTAWMIVDMLKDAVSGGTGTSAKISGQTVAGKTGTNSDQKRRVLRRHDGLLCQLRSVGGTRQLQGPVLQVHGQFRCGGPSVAEPT